MSSIPLVSVKPEVKQSISPESNIENRCKECNRQFGNCSCHRRMYKKCCTMLNFILMLILCYLLFTMMCSSTKQETPFRLVKRY